MSKYIVLYNYELNLALTTGSVKLWFMAKKRFDNYKEAYKFTQKNDGVVLQTVEPKVIEPEESNE